eukprot:CAMPEP_0175034456 /NCGR_PEP_ID=MMETSP0005-20121125/22634_1 /TAXON_ID=420556 /ORGANISM="Ochromonas sp., Strain CCMP1393" /LENGTH=78 /DNA_ID=CAMNT_0016295325 /DNA_START=136 /DNA_END=372 /DNA_ORIENTATION=+
MAPVTISTRLNHVTYPFHGGSVMDGAISSMKAITHRSVIMMVAIAVKLPANLPRINITTNVEYVDMLALIPVLLTMGA